MKRKLALGIIAFFALLGVINSQGNSHQQVAGVQTEVTQIIKATIPPTSTPTPTVTPTSIPTSTPIPLINTTSNIQTGPETHTCAGATALCTDGSCSYAAHHQGACSHHGGVAEWNP